MTPAATIAEFRASLPRILAGDDPINARPVAFYRARVLRFALAARMRSMDING